MKLTFSFGTESVTREQKGKSLLTFPESYCIVDIETTGLSPAYDSIIEIGALKIESGVMKEKFSSLVRPGYQYSDGTYIDEYIQELTGITNDMLSSAPDAKTALTSFRDFIQDYILIAHNAHFDINFLYDSFIEQFNMPLTNDFVDTLRLSRKIHKDLEHHRLSDIASFYRVSAPVSHRALGDCETTYSCYLCMKENIIKEYGDLDLFSKKLKYGYRASDIHSTSTDINPENILFNKTVVFTGVLEKMTRKEAMQIVANMGGINADGVTKKTNYLILGNNDYCSSITDGKSSKHKKAEQMKLKGYDIEIIPENVFYDMISEE